ncbi:MAG: Clp protease N-terminal domain-containing protein [Candidatus Dormibacteria bacterium]
MYPYERFTEKAKLVLTLAQDEAEKAKLSYIGTEHVLLGLLREGDGLAAKVLANLGVEIEKVRETIESALGRNERIIVQQIIPTSRVKQVIEFAFEEAKRMNNSYVGTEHLLLGLQLEGEGLAARVLEDLGANQDKVRAELDKLLQQGVGAEPAHQGQGSAQIDEYCLVDSIEEVNRLAATNGYEVVQMTARGTELVYLLRRHNRHARMRGR